ncbi:arginase family protein [Amycolatopsis sp. CA-128772]|uniref:arginase family protein n=1 Tax=Amycolatopsis sp. CA-128772 TaxID=2073159 RepID=UPI000CD0E7CA|nr:arginase family protein [Amycolatopsis sp. CA-128772]
MRNPVLIDAPSDLGLRPPAEGAVPGCYKTPGVLRDLGILNRLGAADGGVVTPGRYVGTWQPGDGVRNAAALAAYTRALADRVASVRASGGFPVVLGGDCSISLGAMPALRRAGRYGIAYLDGHDDFRHLGIADHVGAAAGEDLAITTGRGASDLADIDGLRPYVRDEDVLDPAYVSAVDSPDPGGLDPDTLVPVLRELLSRPGAAGFELTVFDPDPDPDGRQAALVADVLERTLR